MLLARATYQCYANLLQRVFSEVAKQQNMSMASADEYQFLHTGSV
jgi:hypothetical protein